MRSPCWLIAALTVLPFTALPATAGAPPRPNIVFILIDDLRADDIGCAGHPFVKTPNIDRLAREGVRFRNMFATTPLCSPSRASFLTGQYAHTHGVIDNRDNTAHSMTLMTWPRLLQRANYSTGYVGKWHMGTADAARPGFDRWVSFTFEPRPGKKSAGYVDPEINIDGARSVFKGYMTDILTDQAVQFIESSRGRPFALYLAHKAVHPDLSLPFEKADYFVPADRHKKLYADVPIPRAPSFKDTLEGKPALQRKIGDLPPIGPQTATTDETIRNRLRMLAAVDESVGRILAALEAAKQLDNTVIVFTSDNGYFYGEHGLSDERRLAYEEAIRLPLLIRYPPLVKAGTVRDEMVLNIDMAPTMLELARVGVPKEMQGRSIVPLLKGESPEWRKSFMIEYWSDPIRVRIPNMGYEAVRTDRWKYIRYAELKDMDELYDHQADPYEMKNQVKSPQAQQTLKEMQAELERLRKETGAPKR
jgi:N-acetylglucosamine-6-sulfatase